MTKNCLKLLFIAITVFATSLQNYAQVISVREKIPEQNLIKTLTGTHWYSNEKIKLRSAIVDGNEIRIRFDKNAANALITQEKLNAIADSVRLWTNKPQAKVTVWSEQRNLAQLIPSDTYQNQSNNKPIVTRIDANALNHTLNNKTFAVWNSHGRYYEKSLNRWEWQRARLFTTVEDLLSSSFVIPYLVPMLENAGASVYMPRERDLNPHSFIADNDNLATFSAKNLSPISTTTGYKYSSKINDTDNPFRAGTAAFYRLTPTDTIVFSISEKNINEDEPMAIYIAYPASPDNSNQVSYTIRNQREEATYIVDQQRGGSMWQYLGKHYITPNTRIMVSANGQVGIDAVRIGGGQGIVYRNGLSSNMSAWAEGARYYLQTDGWESDIYAISGNDYTDDINCRGEWVNALQSKKNISIDAAIALHTDAGIATADTTIGTLAIVTTQNGTGKYPDGRSKNIARNLAHALETQIITDIRCQWDSTWSERGIWDRSYSEARRPDIPTVLLEILSHQNITDIHYALHPQFRFAVCRAIYKALARFFGGANATIQPLAVSNFGLEQVAPDSLRLSWQPTPDPLEPTAMPTQYRIYAHTLGGKERCIATSSNTSVVVYQNNNNSVTEYYIIAENKGGTSFPSQRLSARLGKGKTQLLLVDGFDRTSAPGIVDEPHWRGIIDNIEPAIPYGTEYFRTGEQYDFDPQSEWQSDDAPGCGASYATDELKPQCAKHIHYPTQTYIEQTKEYFENNTTTAIPDSVSIELGEQRTTWYGNAPQRHSIYTNALLNRIEQILPHCRILTIRGAYVGTDIPDSNTAKRIETLLGFRPCTNHASKTAQRTFINAKGEKYTITIAHPDAIEPAKGAKTIEQYTDTYTPATIKYNNIIVSGY